MSELLKITPLGKTITIEPPYTLTWESANGVVWIHHVDAEGKPAGGTYNGVPYDSINELFERKENK